MDWFTSKISAHTSSMIFWRRYPLVTTSASRKVSLPSWTPVFLIPWFLEQLADPLLQRVELLSVQA